MSSGQVSLPGVLGIIERGSRANGIKTLSSESFSDLSTKSFHYPWKSPQPDSDNISGTSVFSIAVSLSDDDHQFSNSQHNLSLRNSQPSALSPSSKSLSWTGRSSYSRKIKLELAREKRYDRHRMLSRIYDTRGYKSSLSERIP